MKITLWQSSDICMYLLNFQPRIMHFNLSDWFTPSRFSAHIPYFDLIWRVTVHSVGKLKLSLGQNGQKSRFCELSIEKIQEMLENVIPAAF